MAPRGLGMGPQNKALLCFICPPIQELGGKEILLLGLKRDPNTVSWIFGGYPERGNSFILGKGS